MKNLTIIQLDNLSKVLLRLSFKNKDDQLQQKISKIGKYINNLIDEKFDLLSLDEQREFNKRPMLW